VLRPESRSRSSHGNNGLGLGLPAMAEQCGKYYRCASGQEATVTIACRGIAKKQRIQAILPLMTYNSIEALLVSCSHVDNESRFCIRLFQASIPKSLLMHVESSLTNPFRNVRVANFMTCKSTMPARVILKWLKRVSESFRTSKKTLGIDADWRTDLTRGYHERAGRAPC
jgi:hypothetical protein